MRTNTIAWAYSAAWPAVFFAHRSPSADNVALLWLPTEAEWLFVETENKQEEKLTIYFSCNVK